MHVPKQTIFVSNASKLKINHGALEIDIGSRTVGRIPLEDIWVLIIESQQVLITAKALSDLCEAGIGTMVCGNKHMPAGLLLPIGAHSRHAAIVEDQLLMPKPLKKRLWQAIVQRKIRNQARVLAITGNTEKSNELDKVARAVLSDDSNGREAVAASIYFRVLTPNGGRRNSDLTPLLDYGYAVLRAGIARCAVAGGWLVSRGIHHCNDLNAFNLADDFIEPFRPVIDLIVAQVIEEPTLNTESKKQLAAVFSYYVYMNGSKHTVQSAIVETIDSFKRAVLDNDASQLHLPEVIPLEQWTGEEK
jgi:CRISP-associated protein Cas1